MKGKKYFTASEIREIFGTVTNNRCTIHYANNKGRGSSNVTLSVLAPNAKRPAQIRWAKTGDILYSTRCAGFRGCVSKSMIDHILRRYNFYYPNN